MEWITKKNILIVGLGLMGGSYARCLKRMGYHVMAIDNKPSSIAYALDNDIIDEGAFKVDEDLIRKADVAIFALYPKVFKEWIRDNQKFFKNGVRITDVTGVKSCVVYEIQDILRDDLEYSSSPYGRKGSVRS